MEFYNVFVLWVEKNGQHELLPGCFLIGSHAMFWAEIFTGVAKSDVVVDAVPADGYLRAAAAVEFCAQVSEESFNNAWGLLERFCREAGGLAERSSMARGNHFNRAEF